MAKYQGNSAQHPVEGNSSNVPKGSLSRSAKIGISIAAVIVGLLLITLCYYTMQGMLIVHQIKFSHFRIYETY